MDQWLLSLTEKAGWGIPVFILLTNLFSGFLSGILGIEREIRGQSAGLRTHVLLAVGSSLMMSISVFAIKNIAGVSFDASRIGAGVVSGIGFLCAGCIIRNGTSVKGLTTSATLWICGGIGLACGAGFVLEAIIATGVAFVFLIGLVFFEKFLDRRSPSVHIIADYSLSILSLTHQKADDLQLVIKDIHSDNRVDEKDRKVVDMVIVFAYKSSPFAVKEFMEYLSQMDLVYAVSGSKFGQEERK